MQKNYIRSVLGVILALAPAGSWAQPAAGDLLALAQRKAAFTAATQFQSSASGAVMRSIASKLSDVVNIRDFGAKCDGKTDDDAAITRGLSALTPGEQLVFPAGVCVYSMPKTLPIVQRVSIIGAGAQQTVLLYKGSNTKSDLWTVGDGTTSMTGWSISGLRFDSMTAMTGGAALHLKRMQNGNELVDVDAGALSQTVKNLFNGIWLDNVNVFKYSRFNIQTRNEGLMMNGATASDEGSDVFLDDGVITFSSIAYHVGGGQGGVYFGKILAFGNKINFQVDNLLAHRRNREIFFSNSAVSDGTYGYGIWINDTLTSNAPIVMNGALGSAGMMGSGGAGGIDVYIQSWPNGRISFGPGQLYNATGDGMRIDDASTIVTIDPGRHIFNNGGYGVNATVPTSNIFSLAQYTAENVSGNYSNNVHLGSLNVGGAISGTDILGKSVVGATITNTRQQIDKSYVYTLARTGQTVSMATGEQTRIINSSEGLATLSIVLPTCDSAYDGSIARFATTKEITTLTVKAASGSAVATPAALAAGAGHAYICVGTYPGWFPLY